MNERLESVVARLSPRLSSGRTALFLYVLLVVLPAVVFGGLLWRQLRNEQQRVLDALPLECADAARRLSDSCAKRVDEELRLQQSYAFEVYREEYFPENLGPLIAETTPLLTEVRRPAVLGHFAFRAGGLAGVQDPEQMEIQVFRGQGNGTVDAPDAAGLLIERVVRDEIASDFGYEVLPVAKELDRVDNEGWGEHRRGRLRAVVLNVADGPIEECRMALEDDPQKFEDEFHDIYVSYFEYRLAVVDMTRPPLLLAYRTVIVPQYPMPGTPTCLEAITSDTMLVQGIVFDPEWLYDRMPQQEAAQVLGPTLQFLPPGVMKYDEQDMTLSPSNLLMHLGTLEYDQPNVVPMGTMFVAGDAGKTRAGHREQNAWFGGVALILTISMGVGIRLLLSSIRRSRSEAERTRNFVASVTHELRTPIAAVKLYGEMLNDGWIKDEERRSEYLQRIVAESDRLDGLVDRVLLRRRLSDRDHEPAAGILNAEVEQLRPSLEMVGGRKVDDIEFDLAEDLPKVLLLPEGVHVVLTNLVENARKYAPVPVATNGTPPEPILVRTRTSRKGRVLLEVLDRGPGIPEEDRERVFQAFLRLGDEATRKTKGTGLGLHLVALQARAMKARVRALPRQGGGTVFQVIFAKA